MKIKILCTLGPASLNPRVIEGLTEREIDLFRINLSHTALEDVERIVSLVRAHSDVPICLDSEGPQVRCGVMHPDVVLEAGATVRLRSERIVGDAGGFTLWPETVFAALGPEANLTVDFDGAVLRVVSVGGGDAVAEVVTPGKVRSNKAVVVDPPPELPALSQKDLGAIAFGASNGITHYALSFASAAEDVEHLRSLATPGAHIIAKIESRAGVRNMDGIIEATDSVLIDRGDLSREIPLEHVPYYQKAIARRANRWNRPVYVATNLLESMVTATVPTIAEANDIANTLLDGVHGLVLAAETAIGVDPIASVDIVRRAVRAFERSSDRQLLDDDHLTLVNPSAG